VYLENLLYTFEQKYIQRFINKIIIIIIVSYFCKCSHSQNCNWYLLRRNAKQRYVEEPLKLA